MAIAPKDHIDYFDLNYNVSSLVFNSAEEGIATSSGINWKAIAAKVAVYVFPIIFAIIAIEVVANLARLFANLGILAANHAITLWKGPAEQPHSTPEPPAETSEQTAPLLVSSSSAPVSQPGGEMSPSAPDEHSEEEDDAPSSTHSSSTRSEGVSAANRTDDSLSTEGRTSGLFETFRRAASGVKSTIKGLLNRVVAGEGSDSPTSLEMP